MKIWEDIDKNLGFDPRNMEKERLLSEVARVSPKLRCIAFLIAYITIILRTKVMAWVEYPWTQLLIQLFLEYAGVSGVSSLHQFTSAADRANLCEEFNANDEPKILLCNYRCSAATLSLHKQRYLNIIAEPATSKQEQHEAESRVRRVEQTKEQMAIILLQVDTHTRWQFCNQQAKALTEMMAHVSDDGEMQRTTPNVNSNLGNWEQAAEKLWAQITGGTYDQQSPFLEKRDA